MNRETLDRWCERGILGLVLAILVFGPLATGAVRTRSFLIIQGLTIGVLLLWGARFWLSRRPQLLWPPICWAVVAFVLYAIGRYLTADIEYVARQELIRILVYAFLFFAILNNLHRQETTQIIGCTLVFLAMGLALLAVYQLMTRAQWVWHHPVDHRGGASGTFISRNHLGGFLEMLLPLGLAYTLTSRLKPVVKVLLGYASLVMLAGIAATISRGTYVSTALALILFFGVLLLHRTYRLPSLVLLVVLLGAGAYYLPRSFPITKRVVATFEGGRLEEDCRVLLWRSALEMWQEDVWWGVGPAHYDHRFRQFRPEAVQARPDWTHNDYLNTLVEWGIVGTGLVAVAWVLLGVGLIKTWPHVRPSARDIGGHRTSNKFALVLGTAAGLTAILAHSTVDFNMHIPSNAILAVALMAMLSGCLRFATERYWVTVKPGGKVLASVVLGAGMIYLGLQGWRRSVEYVWLERAARAPVFSPAQAACLERAFAAEPGNPETAYAAGEAYRIQSSEGGDNYRELAERAMEWFKRCMDLNPWSGYSRMRYGWCLDWAGRGAESRPYFERAIELDPKGYLTAANVGLHYVQAGDLAAARTWFERSLRLDRAYNMIARNYLPIVNSRLQEAATNEMSARLTAPLK